MTWNDLIRKYIPKASDDECDYILWEKTCFPMGEYDVIEKQIQEYKNNIIKTAF